GLAFHPAGGLLAAGAEDGTVSLWDRTGTGRRRKFGPGPFGPLARQVAFTPEGRYLVVAASNGTVCVLRTPIPPPPYDPGPARSRRARGGRAPGPAAADALKRENVPPGLLKLAGGGDPARVSPEVVALLGDTRFRMPVAGLSSWMTQDREGKWLAVPIADKVALFDAPTGGLGRTPARPRRRYALRLRPHGKAPARGERGR